ncbi:MAG: L,D-transpeptidase family protein [Thermodesulfobacteriaceae bacterium]|nr:L,D-transpeptidase family protein [Thermodesulfobacteriaceae bacterium]
MITHKLSLLALYLLFYITFLYSQAFGFTPLEKNRYIFFKNKHYQIKKGDTLIDLAVSFKLGYQHLVWANPKLDPWVPEEGATIVLPYQILIPEEFLHPESEYLLINLPEMRLYYFRNKSFKVFPIGIGDEGKLPPLGKYLIVRKKEKPFWYPTPSIQAEEPDLPLVVPPGPDNPMGEYALYLDRGFYAIHGTNKAESIGRRTTHGCFRLYPEDIKTLFHLVPTKTPVYLVYEPYKIALTDKKIYLQAFPDLEKKIKNPFLYLIKKLDALTGTKGVNYQINLIKLEKILANPDGLVHHIGEIK